MKDVLAEPGPGPAGGSAAALVTTMAAGLVRLVARVNGETVATAIVQLASDGASTTTAKH